MIQQSETAKKDKLQIIDWLVEHFPSAFLRRRVK